MPVEYKKVEVKIPENVRELFAQNLKEIQSCFPETKKYGSLNKIPNKAIFARLMDTQDVSFTAAEAFALANLEYVNTHPDVYKKGIKKLLQVIDKLEKRLGDEQCRLQRLSSTLMPKDGFYSCGERSDDA